MNEIEQRIRAQAGPSVIALNPHIFKSKMPLPQALPEMSVKSGSRGATTDEQKLNGLERAWLAVLREAGYPYIGIQSVTLKLADGCRYTPDFFTRSTCGSFTAWETKGFFRDDAKVKIKVAARLFTFFRFLVVTRRKKRDGGGFDIHEVKP